MTPSKTLKRLHFDAVCNRMLREATNKWIMHLTNKELYRKIPKVSADTLFGDSWCKQRISKQYNIMETHDW